MIVYGASGRNTDSLVAVMYLWNKITYTVYSFLDSGDCLEVRRAIYLEVDLYVYLATSVPAQYYTDLVVSRVTLLMCC